MAHQTRIKLDVADVSAPGKLPDLPERPLALAWARAERANLLACFDHVTRSGQQARVVALTAAMAALLRQDRPWADAIARHLIAIDSARHIGDRQGEARALNDLGDVRQLTCDYPGAAEAHQAALDIYFDLGDRQGEANTLCDLGHLRYLTGDYPGATQAMRDIVDAIRYLTHNGPVWWARVTAGGNA
jgi:Tetratricopeptide repeat